MKFFIRIIDSYKKVVVILGLVIMINFLMVVNSFVIGIIEIKSLVI